jgi:uncharacterized membrane protein YccC
MTLTLVLRPFVGETLPMARHRVVGTLVGVVLAAALVAVLPLWSQVLVQLCLLFLLLAYSALGRHALYVVFVTPFVIFLGGRAEAYTAEVGLQRVIATLVAAVIAGLIAVWLARADRADARPGTVVPIADIEPEDLAGGTPAEASESTRPHSRGADRRAGVLGLDIPRFQFVKQRGRLLPSGRARR